MEIGGYSTTYMRDQADLQWYDLVADEFWFTIPITGVRYSDQDVHPDNSKKKTAYSIASTPVILDTGTTLSYIPSSKIALILTILKSTSMP